MSILTNKIDFVALITAKMANPNGDPNMGGGAQQGGTYDGDYTVVDDDNK